MSATSQARARPTTRIFGIPLSLDPKILIGALVAVAALLFWYNSRGDDTEKAAPAASKNAESAAAVNETPVETKRDRAVRRRSSRNDSETLRLRNIDGTRGDIDPELRLDLLAGLQKVRLPANSRNLFEEGPAAAGGVNGLPVRKIVPAALQAPVVTPTFTMPTEMAVNIPYKYYGFVKPRNPGEANRGFFSGWGQHTGRPGGATSAAALPGGAAFAGKRSPAGYAVEEGSDAGAGTRGRGFGGRRIWSHGDGFASGNE